MAATIFSGKEFARRWEEKVRERAAELTGELKRRPCLVSLFDPDNQGSRIYTAVKLKKAEQVGIEYIAKPKGGEEAAEAVKQANSNPQVDGIMIQLPYGEGRSDQELIDLITPGKDVDGLRLDSPYVPATVRAVEEIVTDHYGKKLWDQEVIVVGNRGEVGSRLVKRLSTLGWKVAGMDAADFSAEKLRRADIVISATGAGGILTQEMIKPGAGVIDVGYPQADARPEVAGVAGFVTPVPGGVGPVTVMMLLANVVGL